MTRYDEKRKEVLKQWSDLQLEKDAKIRELWNINYKLEKLENLIKRYGLAENPRVGEITAELG